MLPQTVAVPGLGAAIFSQHPSIGLYRMLLVPLSTALNHIEHNGTAPKWYCSWHFSRQPNSADYLLPSEWNKLIVQMLYFNWSLSCLSLTTAGHACIRKQNTEKLWAIRGSGHICYIIFHSLQFVDLCPSSCSCGVASAQLTLIAW